MSEVIQQGLVHIVFRMGFTASRGFVDNYLIIESGYISYAQCYPDIHRQKVCKETELLNISL